MMLRLACILDLLRKSFCWSIVALTRCSNPHVHLGTLRSCASRRLPLDSAKKTYARGLIFQLFLFQPVLAQPDIENFLNAFSDEPITQAVVQKKLMDGQYDQEFRHLIKNAFSCAEAYARWSKSTPAELFKAFLKLNLSPQLLVASCDFAFAERANFIAKFSLSYCNQVCFWLWSLLHHNNKGPRSSRPWPAHYLIFLDVLMTLKWLTKKRSVFLFSF